MTEYGFAVRVAGFRFDDDQDFESLADDEITVVPSTSEGNTILDVEIRASSALSAWQEFELFLTERAPHISVQRIDLDLVTLSEIAVRLGVSRETARLWATGQRRKDFPAPFTSAGQSQLWTWADVYDWAPTAEVSAESAPLPTQIVERVNGTLARQRGLRLSGWAFVSALSKNTADHRALPHRARVARSFRVSYRSDLVRASRSINAA